MKENDIAILILKDPVHEEKCVKFETMARLGETFRGKCIAAGWGKLAFQGNSPNELYKVGLPYISPEDCRKRSRMGIAEGVLCAGDFVGGGESTCQGDSGGPLYCPNASGKMVLAGVTSFGHKCNGEVSAFTDVRYFQKWITRNW
ncbi:trypsin-1-like [Octopus sinensis]|uniref:Trypsin-1-like n=1 Tax=Octopus sinensis TaxID=2607531 RepID=A0A6P7SJ38_9MOLL|nr:trypsin-1-like [Octopus sinensis]